MGKLNIEQVIKVVRQVPSLSSVVLEVLASFDNKDVEIAGLVHKLGQDQGLTSSVLRVANSPFFGLSGKVGSVGEAVVVLGFHNLRSLVAAAGIVSHFPPFKASEFDRQAFWSHSLGVAACAQVLAKALGLDQALAFTAGLLHDVGKLVLDAYFHEDFKAVMAHGRAEDMALTEAELAVLGVGHAQVGFELARRWQFPVAIQLAIRDHHQPECEPAILTDLVHVANVLCHALDIGYADHEWVPPLSSGAWTRIRLDWERMPELLKETEQLYAGVRLLVSE